MTERPTSQDCGATSVEYGLMVVAIAAVVVVVIFVIGGYVLGQFRQTCTAIDAEGVTNSSTFGGTCNS